MFLQIIVGSATIIGTVVIEAIFIALAVAALKAQSEWLAKKSVLVTTTVTLSVLTLWLLAGIAVGLWLWAFVFYAIGEFQTMEAAIYFASVSATTLGYGDTLLSDGWRLLSGFIAANGLVLFSLNTAFLFEALRQIHAQMPDTSASEEG